MAARPAGRDLTLVLGKGMSGSPPPFRHDFEEVILREFVRQFPEGEKMRLRAEKAEKMRLRAEKAEKTLATVVHLLVGLLGVGDATSPGAEDAESRVKAIKSVLVRCGLREEHAAYFQEVAERWPVSPDMYIRIQEDLAGPVAHVLSAADGRT